MADVDVRLAEISYRDLDSNIRVATVTFNVSTTDVMPPSATFRVPVNVYVINGDDVGAISKAREYLHEVGVGLTQINPH